MRCNFAVLGIVCVILQSGAVAAQTAPDRAGVQKQIETNERAIIEAIFKNDAKTFHSLVVGDSLILSGDGLLKVAEFDTMMKETAATCKVSKVQTSDSAFYWVNDTTVVHVYKTAMDASCNGEPIKPSWSSSVWGCLRQPSTPW